MKNLYRITRTNRMNSSTRYQLNTSETIEETMKPFTDKFEAVVIQQTPTEAVVSTPDYIYNFNLVPEEE